MLVERHVMWTTGQHDGRNDWGCHVSHGPRIPNVHVATTLRQSHGIRLRLKAIVVVGRAILEAGNHVRARRSRNPPPKVEHVVSKNEETSLRPAIVTLFL